MSEAILHNQTTKKDTTNRDLTLSLSIFLPIFLFYMFLSIKHSGLNDIISILKHPYGFMPVIIIAMMILIYLFDPEMKKHRLGTKNGNKNQNDRK